MSSQKSPNEGDVIRLKITTADPLTTPWNYDIVQQLLDTSDAYERKFAYCMKKSGRLRNIYNVLLRLALILFGAISGTVYFLREQYWWMIVVISVIGSLLILVMKSYDFLKKSRHYRFTAYKYLESKYKILREINKPAGERVSSPVELLIRIKEDMQRAEHDLEANKVDDTECVEIIKFDFKP